MLKHIAIIMDGNRRWARERGLPTLQGHAKGVETAVSIAQACIDNKIPYLTLYVFSLENFKRSEEEKKYLFDLIATELKGRVQEFIKKGTRIRFVGDRSHFPEQVVSVIQDIEKQTQSCDKLNLQLLFCYGGQQEIIAATKQIAADVAKGTLKQSDINQQVFEQHMWTAGIPHPDIVIRTGNVCRLSNFLMYQAAYSELFFSPLMWPDFTPAELNKVIAEFESRTRNFGV